MKMDPTPRWPKDQNWPTSLNKRIKSMSPSSKKPCLSRVYLLSHIQMSFNINQSEATIFKYFGMSPNSWEWYTEYHKGSIIMGNAVQLHSQIEKFHIWIWIRWKWLKVGERGWKWMNVGESGCRFYLILPNLLKLKIFFGGVLLKVLPSHTA